MKKRLIKPTAGIVMCLILTVCFNGCEGDNNSIKNFSDVPSQSRDNSEVQSIATDEKTYTVTNVDDFNDGYAWIWIKENENSEPKEACIDANGKIQFILSDIIKGSFTVHGFKSGYSFIKDESNNYYIIDTSGNVTSSSKNDDYDHILCDGDGNFLVEKCNNNLHEINYTVSVINGNGTPIVKDCYIFDKKITDHNLFQYRGKGVFSYETGGGYISNGWQSRSYDCINSISKAKFSLKSIDSFYDFNSEQTILQGDYTGKNQILDVNGNITELNLKGIQIISGITQNCCICRKSNDESLFIYNITNGQINELYHCGTGISAKICDYNDELFLLEIEDTTKELHDFDGKYWFTLVDYQGNEIFTPKEGDPIGFSSDRITANYENHADKIKVFDNKGNEIIAAKEGELALAQHGIYHDGFLCVNTAGNSAITNSLAGVTTCNNFIDTNGNLLFPNGKISI